MQGYGCFFDGWCFTSNMISQTAWLKVKLKLVSAEQFADFTGDDIIHIGDM